MPPSLAQLRAGYGGADRVNPKHPRQDFLDELIERSGEALSTDRPWNRAAQDAIEQLNGPVAMFGCVAAVAGEGLTGRGIVGQLAGGTQRVPRLSAS